MRLRHLKYLAAYSIPTVVIVSMVLGGSYAFLAIGYVFVAVPFIELFTSGKTVNLSKLEEEVASKDKIYDFLLYALVPLHLFILIYFLLLASINMEMCTISIHYLIMLAKVWWD